MFRCDAFGSEAEASVSVTGRGHDSQAYFEI